MVQDIGYQISDVYQIPGRSSHIHRLACELMRARMFEKLWGERRREWSVGWGDKGRLELLLSLRGKKGKRAWRKWKRAESWWWCDGWSWTTVADDDRTMFLSKASSCFFTDGSMWSLIIWWPISTMRRRGESRAQRESKARWLMSSFLLRHLNAPSSSHLPLGKEVYIKRYKKREKVPIIPGTTYIHSLHIFFLSQVKVKVRSGPVSHVAPFFPSLSHSLEQRKKEAQTLLHIIKHM